MRALRLAVATLVLSHALAAAAQAGALPAAAVPASPDQKQVRAPSPDKVVLTTGVSLSGTVKGQDDRKVYLITPSGRISEIPLSVVERVELGERPPAPAVAPVVAAPVAAAEVAAAAAPASVVGMAQDATANDASEGPSVSVGLGAGLSGDGASFLYLPIQLKGGFLLEPEVGFERVHASGQTLSTRHIGLGLFMVDRIDPLARVHYGIRTYTERDTLAKLDTLGAALAVGGE